MNKNSHNLTADQSAVKRCLAWALTTATLLGATAAQADTAQVEQAMFFIRASCGVKEARLEIQRPGDGRVHLHLRTGSTPRGSVSLVQADLERFTDLSLQLTTQQPLDMSACMEPTINQVISSLLEMPQNVASLPMAVVGSNASNNTSNNTNNSGGYIPPMLSANSPPAAVPATAAVVQQASNAAPGDPVFTIQGCRAAGRNVVCEVKVTNPSPQDVHLVLQARQTVLYDAGGGAYAVDDVRMGNQGGVDYRGVARIKVIADTAPVLNLTFHRVPELVLNVKRLEVSLGPETLNGVRLQKLVAADLAVAGR